MLIARLLAVLVLLPVLVGLFSFGGLGGRAWLQQPGGVIQPDVVAALQTAAEVEVMIHLVPLPLPPPDQLGPATLEDYKRQVAALQDGVLLALPAADFTVTQQYSVVPALAGRITATGVEKLQGRPDVLRVSSNTPLFLTLAESVPLIRAPEVHQQGYDGAGVTVAVLDSGIASAHQDLGDSIVGEECFANCPNGTNRQSGSGSAGDDHGHGTHVSGIITSNGTTPGLSKGVAPSAGIFAYRVCAFSPILNMAVCSTDALLGALDHILDVTLQRNALGLPPLTPFINMSLGDPNGWTAGTCNTDHPWIDQTLGNLRVFGVLSFAASGNYAYKDGISWPACSPAVVSVGGVYDADEGYQRWPLDPTLPLRCEDLTTAPDKAICFSNSRNDLDLLAPGALIRSAWPDLPSRGSCRDPVPGVLTCAGTSMAAPHAVGVAALLKQALPGITPGEIEQILEETGTPVTDDFDPNNIRTTPRVDARAAVLDHDYDEDGCTNEAELGTTDPDGDGPQGPQHIGGLRDPENPWDFYDTNGDKIIDLANDILGVLSRYGLRAGDPGYDPAYDRGPSAGPYAWSMTAPDGTIDLPNDIMGVITQYQHDCR